MEDFGSDAIDADGDDELTCEGVRSFMEATAILPAQGLSSPSDLDALIPSHFDGNLLEEFGGYGVDADVVGFLSRDERLAGIDVDLMRSPPFGPPPCVDLSFFHIQIRPGPSLGLDEADADTNVVFSRDELELFIVGNRPPEQMRRGPRFPQTHVQSRRSDADDHHD